MSFKIRKVDYFYTTVEDAPGESYQVLAELAKLGINQVAFTAVPVGVDRTQIGIFPADAASFVAAAKRAGMALDGPHKALLVQGDDEMGALVGIHRKLFEANVNVYASTGVTDGKGAFGYLIYVRPEQYDRAARAMGI